VFVEEVERIVQDTVICTEELQLNVTVFVMRTGVRIVQGTVICTDRGTATERYCVCYEDVGRIVQGTVICTDRGTVLNVTVFVMRKLRG
jgi:hypothetical protein